MAPVDNSKWAVLRKLALARFLEDAEVAEIMCRVEELAVQQPGDPAAFVAATEALMQADEEKRIGEALVVINQRAHSIVGSCHAEQEAWVLAAAVAAYQQKEVVEVAEDTARQAAACCSRSPLTPPPSSPRSGLFWDRTAPPSILSRQPTTRPWPRPTWWHGRAS
jgi:hypothetical protein